MNENGISEDGEGIDEARAGRVGVIEGAERPSTSAEAAPDRGALPWLGDAGLADEADTELPPGPRAPAGVQALEWVRRPAEFMERNRRRYGPIFRDRLGPMQRAAFVSEPRTVRAILAGDPEVLRMGDANGLMRPAVGPRSILLLDGEEHLQQRRLLLPPFKGDHVRGYRELIAEAAERRIAAWPMERPLALQPEMEEIAFSTILAIVMGRDAALAEARIRTLLPKMMELCASPFNLLPWFHRELGGVTPWGRLLATVEELDEVVFGEIHNRRIAPDLEARDDLLSMLVQARHPDGRALSDREIRDETVTLLMAGWETTSSALAWAFERLARHPEVTDRLASTLGAGDRTYLDAVVKETLRQRPVIPALVRKLAAPMRFGEYAFPAGWVLMPSVYLLHHEPSIYPDPHEFRPERFLDGPPARALWIPFGGGVRRCLGASLAELEMTTVVEAVVTRLALQAVRQAPEPARRQRFTLTPGEGTLVSVNRRRRRAPASRRAAPVRESRAETHAALAALRARPAS